jgi:predicted nucleotide-binding protein
MKLTVQKVREVLRSAGYAVEDEVRLKNNTGSQVKLATGQKVSVYDKGTCYVQGSDAEPINAILGLTGSPSTAAAAAVPSKVFVVYGHDKTARDQLEAMLRRWKIEPLIVDQLPSNGQTLIEKLEVTVKDVHFGVVLATPDDEGHRVNHPDEKALRARQNVVLELGMLLALLGRSRVAILLKDQKNTEKPSDIQGLIYIPFKNDVAETKNLLAKEMAEHGFVIGVKDL